MTTSDGILLSMAQLNENLGKISNWNLEDNGRSIVKNFEFGNFKEAVSFLNKIAEIAEQEGHHPEMKLYLYNNLEVKLTTFSAGGLTQKDFEIAGRIDKLTSSETSPKASSEANEQEI
ncbi:4a-hydroxytetrahydrobiopterin dehydratase [Candidatus Pacearchaeota archaeon]|nr:4a-hydroxytetrahydrobiopterin dehydratase [Candidatus Pacearchaeota archaeon]